MDDEIHNDLGASFTKIERKGKKIVKKAYYKGEEKLRDEIKWYLMLKDSPFSKLLPEIYKYSLEKGNVFVEMKYYNYPNMRKIILDNLNEKFYLEKRWEYLFKNLKNHLYIKKYSKDPQTDFVEKTHFKKLKKRLAETLRIAPFLKEVVSNKTLIINGEQYYNVGEIIPKLQENEKILKKLTPEKIYYSHGDLHANNMLCGILSDNMVLIDCRGKSPYGDLYFDVAYDIAKIYHDMRSYYSLIEKHYYSIFLHIISDSVEIEYDFNKKDLMQRIDESRKIIDGLINKRFKEFSLLSYRAEFTEAMLYLTMVPFHLKTRSEGLMCYTTGILRLNEWQKKYHPELL